MATKKISELTEVTSPVITDTIPIVNTGETKKVKLSNLKSVLEIETATQAEAEAGTDNVKKMTALRTKEAIEKAKISPTFTGTVTLPATTSIGNVSNTELGYLDGVTSAIQTQFGAMFINRGAITTDFNTYTTAGMYTYGGGTVVTNRPPDYGIVIVFNAEDYKAQVVVNGISKIYFRFNNGTDWSAWKTLTGV